MAYKHIFKVRRGVRHVNDAGETIYKEDGTPERDDWGTYTAKADHIDPLGGELVVEFEYNSRTGTSIPRLKIGDGKSTFAKLAYIGIESFLFPKSASVTLPPAAWQPVLDDDGSEIPNRYYQPVTVNGATITQNSKIDLQPSPADLAIFHEKDITFTAINSGGNVRVCVIGQKPTQEYTIQVTVTEVSVNGNS